MHLLHRSSVFGGGKGNKKAALRRVGSSPRVISRSDSIKKRSGGGGGGNKKGGGGGVKQGSKRARLRAGLAAALQELNLAGRRKRGGGISSVTTQTEVEANAEHAAAGPEEPAVSNSSRGSVTVLPLELLMLALACVVALGRAPAVCCCTCAAWCCRGSSHRRRSAATG
ncbi:hypothetical protein PR202_gb23695 [Eleusine coracana subsp. coracana]|uniref:Uncharacterized protein n=1 Tax=Eleusine coracana subsp. coracana TaxID=191504 RepID=A0AAV5FIW5_ELECO|nr:hypothetical protein QOZ80_5BG0439130 [Eleusine coracana subsp. coracana]GJN34976.1 hypothetical protein PR202_gb23695 [Eleusine coracana subsp. coracana]